MTYPTASQVGAYNRAALSIARTCTEVAFEHEENVVRARLGFGGFSPHAKGHVTFEVHRFSGDGVSRPYVVERVLFHAHPEIMAGERPLALSWRDTAVGDGLRHVRHMRIDVADLFSTNGDATLEESLALVENAFASLREAVEKRMHIVGLAYLAGFGRPSSIGNAISARVS